MAQIVGRRPVMRSPTMRPPFMRAVGIPAGAGALFYPPDIIADGDVAVFYDYQRLSSMYQTVEGQTNSAVGDDVGLMLDVSQGATSLTAFSNLISNGDFSNGTVGYTDMSVGTGSFSVTGEVLTMNGPTFANRAEIRQEVTGFEVGETYLITVQLPDGGTNQTRVLWADAGSGGPNTAIRAISFPISTSKTFEYYYFTPTATTHWLLIREQNGTSKIDDITVRKLPSIIAVQETDTARPTLTLDATNDVLYLANDGDDSLSIDMPDLGTNATVISFFRGGVVDYLEGQTISGTINMPLSNKALMYIDRALTAGEKSLLETWNSA